MTKKYQKFKKHNKKNLSKLALQAKQISYYEMMQKINSWPEKQKTFFKSLPTTPKYDYGYTVIRILDTYYGKMYRILNGKTQDESRLEMKQIVINKMTMECINDLIYLYEKHVGEHDYKYKYID